MTDLNRGIAARLLASLGAACALLPATAPALDYQVHGFGAQAFALSEGNNIFGSSTNGSVDFYEAALNGSVRIAPGLIGSGQLLWRQEGRGSDGGVDVDYALLDYQLLVPGDADLGVRAGRVKHPLGLFNDTRDVVFARPGILMPQVYLESQGLRSILFSSDGAQLYGGRTVGEHYLTVVGGHSLDFDFTEEEERRLLGSSAYPGTVRVSEFYYGRLQDSWDAERVRVGLSYLHARLDAMPDPPSPFAGNIEASIYIASARYNAERYALTAEYLLIDSRTQFPGSSGRSKSDAFYIQGDYLLCPRWTLLARFDGYFTDRGDRDGSGHEARTGQSATSRYAHDYVVGGKWLPDEHWGVWTEFHYIDGSATVPRLENQGRAIDDHWHMLLLMAAYRF